MVHDRPSQLENVDDSLVAIEHSAARRDKQRVRQRTVPLRVDRFDQIIDAVETLVADTYTRLGFVYDPDAPVKKKIRFYVNGVPQSTYVGEASGDATVYIQDTTNFPGGEEMGPVIALKMASANDLTVTLRKLRCVQLL